MKLYRKNAEFFLCNILTTLRQERYAWKCVVIPLPQLLGSAMMEVRRDAVCNMLEELFRPLDGLMFICRDGDLILLFEGRARPVLAELHRILGLPRDDANLRAYDLWTHWDLVNSLCDQKFKQLVA